MQHPEAEAQLGANHNFLVVEEIGVQYVVRLNGSPDGRPPIAEQQVDNIHLSVDELFPNNHNHLPPYQIFADAVQKIGAGSFHGHFQQLFADLNDDVAGVVFFVDYFGPEAGVSG